MESKETALTEKYFEEHLAQLKQDVNESQVKEIEKSVKEAIGALKADLSKDRTFNSGAGASTDKKTDLSVFADSVKGEPIVDELPGAMRSWDKATVKAFVGYAKAVYDAQHGNPLSEPIKKAMGEYSGVSGGFLLPIEFTPQLLRLIIETQLVRPRAFVLPMARETMWIPRVRDTSHVTTIHGGDLGTWVAENTALTESSPALGQVQLIAKKFSDYKLVANELIADSPIAIAPLLGTLMSEALGFFEDASAIHGNGAGQLLGFVACPAMISVARKVTSHITYDDVVAMYSRMLPASLSNAVWVASPSAFPDIAKMSVAVGTGGSAVWISNYTTAQGTPPATIFGRPLIISEKFATLGSAGDLVFCDFSYYVIGARQEIALTSSEHVAFASDQTAFRAIERLDGMPWIEHTLEPHNLGSSGGTTLSPFVKIAA